MRTHGRVARRPLLGGALALVALCLLAFGAPAALGRVRYAAPGGNGPQPCDQSAPCSLEEAASGGGPLGVEEGDEVVVEPGTYHPTEPIEVEAEVAIGGAPDEPSPLIEGVEPTGFYAADDYVHDLRIDQASGLIGFGQYHGIAERVYVTAGVDVEACNAVYGTLRDSLCVADPSTGIGIEVGVGGKGTFGETLVGDTAIGAYAINVAGNQGAKVTASATNVIADGALDDLHLDSDSKPGSSATLELVHSDYSSASAEGSSVTYTPIGSAGNVTAEPLFADAPAGNFQSAAGSPTIGGGDVGAVLPGETALNGAPRTSVLACGAPPSVDIGAYQVPSVANCPVPPAPVTRTSPPPPSAPSLSLFLLSRKTFAVGSGKAKGKGKPRGTTIAFSLSEPATVTLTVVRQKTGKKCRRAPRSKPCLATVGSFSATGVAGGNKVPFGGKVNGKALAPGRYLLQASATTSALSSPTLTTGFRVVPAGG